MTIGTWIKSPLEREYQIIFLHPMKDEVLLIDTEGFTCWRSLFILLTRWKRIK